MNQGDAFGVGLDAEFAFPGLQPTERPAARRAHLTLAPRRELLDGWPDGSERIATTRRADGRVAGSWSRHPDAGYLLRAEGFGTFVVSADGTEARCAPVLGLPTWKWQRYLVGQVLPLLAVIHGHEVFHASVVAKAGRAVAMVGPSGGGKSSLAAGLVLRGHRYLADDVLAVRPDAGLVAEPGVALTSLRWDAADRLAAEDLARLGSSIGQDAEGNRLAVDLADAAPLAGLYVLARDPAVGGVTFEPLRPVDPRILLAASYNFVVLDRARRLRQLDVCAELATGVPVHRLVVGTDIGPAATAEALDHHIQRELG